MVHLKELRRSSIVVHPLVSFLWGFLLLALVHRAFASLCPYEQMNSFYRTCMRHLSRRICRAMSCSCCKGYSAFSSSILLARAIEDKGRLEIKEIDTKWIRSKIEFIINLLTSSRLRNSSSPWAKWQLLPLAQAPYCWKCLHCWVLNKPERETSWFCTVPAYSGPEAPGSAASYGFKN